MRISAARRQDNENWIRTALDQLLRGVIPPDGRCDITTLAHEPGVDRTAFYGTHPYADLRVEFEQRGLCENFLEEVQADSGPE